MITAAANTKMICSSVLVVKILFNSVMRCPLLSRIGDPAALHNPTCFLEPKRKTPGGRKATGLKTGNLRKYVEQRCARLSRFGFVTDPPAVLVLPHSDVRQEIQSRVAAFQAHQHRFHREREAYFKSVLTRARAEIDNGPDAPSA
jgi:hypothetical protein